MTKEPTKKKIREPMELFFEIHRNLPREGPGCNSSTRRAISMLPKLPTRPKILDLGCGPGMQTVELAKQTNGSVLALDNHVPYLQALEAEANSAGLAEQITTQKGSMLSLAFPPEEFDLIWSEGAISIVGFQKGIESWQRFLKTNGYLVVSDLCWLKPYPPKRPLEFWKENYPQMKSIPENLQTIKEAGLAEVGYFVLPESGWWDDYYQPLEKRIQELMLKYARDSEAKVQLKKEQAEIDLFREFSEWYGYVFYLMQKNPYS